MNGRFLKFTIYIVSNLKLLLGKKQKNIKIILVYCNNIENVTYCNNIDNVTYCNNIDNVTFCNNIDNVTYCDNIDNVTYCNNIDNVTYCKTKLQTHTICTGICFKLHFTLL